MKPTQTPRRKSSLTDKAIFGVLAFTMLGGLAMLSSIATGRDVNPPADLPKTTVSTRDLGGSDRFLIHVQTDKPIYRPGETLYTRATILHANKHTPLDNNHRPHVAFEIIGPKGETVAAGFNHNGEVTDSVAGSSWKIPDSLAGGEYTLKVSCPTLGLPPAERKFDIRAYRAPRLKTQVEFLRDGYGPGDEVTSTVSIERAEGGVPVGSEVTVQARVDGELVHTGKTTVGPDGYARTDFKLPEKITRGEGTLAYIIEDGGVVETASKTIPILLQTVDLSTYPEGGSLVKGLPSRIYFEAKTPAKKPADIAGVIVDANGNEVATFRSKHEGRGRFDFTPLASGEAYTMKITQPTGINTTYKLPEVADNGAVIRALSDNYAHDEQMTIKVGVLNGRRVIVTLSDRERELASVTTKGVRKLGPYMPEITFTPPRDAEGVLIVTVRDAETNVPLAERLIYREPKSQVKIDITADRARYIPGQDVKLTIKATDENENPVEAVVGVTVTDDSVLEMIEKREQAPRLPVMVLLESDVQELADAHVYLDPTNDEAPLALDLLLGTQGWRRFAFVRTADFISEHGDNARRVLAMRTVTQQEMSRLGTVNGRPRGVWRNAPAAVQLEGGAVAVADAAPIEAAIVEDGPVDPRRNLVGDKKQVAANADDFRDELAEADGFDQAAERNVRLNVKKLPEMAADRDQLVASKPVQPALTEQPMSNASLVGKLEEAQVAHNQRERLVMADREMEAKIMQRDDFILIREYAHKARPDRKAGDRRDFTETLYFGPAVKTDASTGEATVSFALSDAVTAFRVHADAFTHDGSLGASSTTVESVQPFYVEPKLPLEVTSGDLVQLPVAMVNGTDATLTEGMLTITADPGVKIGGVAAFEIPGGGRIRQIVDLGITHGAAGETDFAIQAVAGMHLDKVTRKLRVVPRGFPTELAIGGMLDPDGSIKFDIVIPDTVVPGSLLAMGNASPTPLANMTTALERLIREPSGCFEQTSSTTYPLVMAQQYFKSHQGVDPALVTRSSDLLSKGYDRLVSFECSDRGYEWFGQNPGHEALTAYGVLEFHDMAQVHPVDPEMLQRTRGWLLAMRDGDGGFKRERRALHTWVTDADASNAYCTWALLEAGEPASNLTAEVELVINAASKSSNAYVKAIAANVAQMAGDSAVAKTLLDDLADNQNKEGFVDGATTSIVGSGGDALKIETTSFAMLAWLRDPAYMMNVEKAATYLADTCKAGRFGSTQSTILALRGIVEYDKARAGVKAPGNIAVYVDGEQVGRPVAFGADAHGAINLPDFTGALTPGKHTIKLEMQGGSQMPVSIAINYFAVQPDSSEECVMQIETKLRDTKIAEGSVTELAVKVTNTADKGVPNPIAIVGLPGGFEPRHDQLKELVKQETIASYEVRGREVILYWRGFEAGQSTELPISVTAAVPGKYTAPASRAYLYYTDEHKHWVAGVSGEITPSGE